MRSQDWGQQALKVAVSSQGEGLGSLVDSRFGRCAYLILVDTGTGEVESVPNPSLSSAHGAGIGTVQFLSERGVEAVCTQNVGPNAFSALTASSVRVYSVAGNTVGDVIEQLKQGLLSEYGGATVAAHEKPSGK